MKHGLLYILCAAFAAAGAGYAAEVTVKSPDGRIEAKLEDGKQLSFSITADGKKVLDKAAIGMSTNKGEFGADAAIKGSKSRSVNTEIKPLFGARKTITDNYNESRADLGNYDVIIRVYDDAAAYRFVSKNGGEMIVKQETLKLPLKDADKVIAHIVNGIRTSFESIFTRTTAGGLKALKKGANASMPFIFEKEGMKIALVESDWTEYPGLRIHYPKDADSPRALFAPVPKKLVQKGNQLQPSEVEDYIAKTSGTREFPWRAFIVARDDKVLADNDTVYKLASESKIGDASWITPGPSVWDWWVNWNTKGVDFKCGFNEQMCKYYVDFAADNDIPYITLDAGWHVGREGLGKTYLATDARTKFTEIYNTDENYINGKPHVDIPGVVEYAHSKGVKVVIWCLSKVLYAYPEKALDLFKSWGVDGLKIDFNDRDDQLMIRHIENITKLAADRQMVIEWHGCPAPSGLQRTYPNAITFEAVHGAEVNKWAKTVTPSHNVDLVFTRMLLGPMDYTPGGMRNSNERSFKAIRDIPRVQGTRAHMAAQYVLFLSTLQMISDMPSEYMKEQKLLDFIAAVPTTWDDTKVIEGKMGDYVVIARRKGDKWYLGGMCGWGGKDVEIDLSKFLPEGKYLAKIVRDTVNSDDIPEDYKIETMKATSASKLKISMKSGGGFAVKFMPYK